MSTAERAERALRRIPLPSSVRGPAGRAWRRVRRRADRRSAERETLPAEVARLEEQLDHERLYACEWAYRRVQDRFGDTVLAGPFAGLRYPDWGAFQVEAFAPKVLGTYEMELHGAIEDLIAAKPAMVLNIGSAEGFYAVGIALRLPEATVAAHDLSERARELLALVVEHNGVGDRVVVAGECTHATLLDLPPGSLIVSDCEGAEHDLLDPAAVPQLRSTAMLVETHDLVRPGTSDVLVERFTPSHTITAIPTERRWVSDHPELDFLPIVTQQLAIQEFREGPQQWLVLQPR